MSAMQGPWVWAGGTWLCCVGSRSRVPTRAITWGCSWGAHAPAVGQRGLWGHLPVASAPTRGASST